MLASSLRVALAACALALLPTRVHAEFPYAADPNRCDASGQPLGCVPLANEMSGVAGSCSGEKWKYASTSFCSTDPLVNLSPNELFGVTGMSVEIAWRKETGRSDVVIAVHDSGFMWNDDGAINDLRKKFHVNRGELPAPNPAGGCAAPPGGDPWDCNGDGVFNVPDYDGDPAVTNVNGNAATDPQDLIMLFSDGVDDDGNGYVDDICGWDFFEDDNDPFDEVQYGHGTGEARDSAAEANNGGAIATCPNCMTLPIRVGDSFVADVNAFAQGVVFAVDSGAAVIQEALGTYNQSAFAQAAIDYAYAHDVPVMASAADEDSWHHIFPGPYVHTIVTNAIADFGAPTVPSSWLFLNGCTNFGGNVAVSVSATSCSSEAVGRGSGIAGLVVSAGRNAVDASVLGSPLTANEVRQLLTQTADDVNFDVPGGPLGTPPSVGGRLVAFPDTSRYATQAGFDQFTGYGRVNAFDAVSRVVAGQIPPEAEMRSPTWFQTLDPARDGAFAVVGRVAAARASGYTYRVQIAYGIQPVESDWVDVVPFGPTLGAPVDGVLATVTAADVPAPSADQIARRLAQLPDLNSDYDQFTYTLRVQVRDQPGNQLGEDRRTIFVHADPDLKPAYPLRIGGDGASSPALADLDGDGAAEIVFGTSDGLVYAKRADGSDLPGWPAAADVLPYHAGSTGFATNALAPPRGAILASVAIGDVDGDGLLDVVAADLEGKVYAWDHAGARKAGFPVQVDLAYSTHAVKDRFNRVDRAIIASPALADLDGDGGLDVIVGGNDRHLYVWNGLGVPRPGFPVQIVDPTRVAAIAPGNHKVTPLPGAFRGDKIIDSPAVGDIDGDGALDVVVGSNECYDEPIDVALSSGTSAALGQLLSAAGQSSCNSRVYAVQKDGLNHPGGPFHAGWPAKIAFFTAEILPNVGEGINASPALADVDGDGTLETGVFSAAGPAYLLRADGTSFYGADSNGARVMQTEGGTSTTTDPLSIPALGEGAFGDLTGTGVLSFAAPAAGLGRLLAIVLADQQLSAEDHVAAWIAATGTYQPTFPHHMEDLQFLTGPSIADVGGLPTPEIVAGSAGYFVHAYDVTGVEPAGWPKFTGGWTVANPAVGDVDGDGLNEVVTLTREGFLYVWDTTAAAGGEEWPKKRHDLRNTGNYEEPVGQVANPAPTATPTSGGPTPSPTPAAVACGVAPAASCRQPAEPGKAQLQIRNASPDTKDRLQWKWLKGSATSLADFGDPGTTTGYALCVYDGTASLVAAADVPAGGVCNAKSPRPCWRANGRGWRYVDRDGTPAGVTQLVLRSGVDGKAQILLKGQGALLSDPTLPIAHLPLRVQLVTAAGRCFEATFSTTQRNDAQQVRARAD